MPAPANPSWNVGELPTAALLNARIRDQLNFFKTVPLGIFRKSGTQPVSHNIWTAISWDVEDLDSDAGHSNVTNNTRYTAQTAGWYLVTAVLHWGGNVTGRRELRFRRSGDNTRFWGWHSIEVNNSTHGADVISVGLLYLNVGQYVEVMGLQTSGGSLTIFNDNLDSRFEIRWVRS